MPALILQNSCKSESKVISVPTAWTLTNILHGVMVYLFMHTVKGTPFHTADQGSSRFLTAWEQIDGEIQVNRGRPDQTVWFIKNEHNIGIDIFLVY